MLLGIIFNSFLLWTKFTYHYIISMKAGDKMNTVIGKNIRKFRTEKGLSLEKLAEISSTSSNHLGLIERGVKIPGLNTLEKISKSLDVSIIDILHDSITETKNDTIRKILLKLDTMSSRELESIYLIINEVDKYKNL